MNWLCLILFIITAYLLGSVNPAIIITRLAKGVDIRTLGTHNPGTSNVRRNLGLGWGILVLFLDIALCSEIRIFQICSRQGYQKMEDFCQAICTFVYSN